MLPAHSTILVPDRDPEASPAFHPRIRDEILRHDSNKHFRTLTRVSSSAMPDKKNGFMLLLPLGSKVELPPVVVEG
eukprot:7761412-Pyramimonas_sp.AAC.1